MVVLRTVCLAAVLLLTGVSTSSAQQNFLGAEEIVATGTSYHTFARAGEATIRVLVIGTGGGIYEIGANTRMDEFLALLGGAPQFAVQNPGTRTDIRIQLLRIEDGRRSILYDEQIEDMLMEPSQYPVLQDGDVFKVDIKVKNRFSWRDGLTLLSTAGTTLLLLDRLGVVDLAGNPR